MNATEIYELGSSDEARGLLTGVQYLDTMCTALDQSDYHTDSSTFENPMGANPSSGLDFTRRETFQFLKAAANSDEREPKHDCVWSSQ